MTRYLAPIYLYLCLFPWVSFGLLNLDTQPFFIIFGVLIFLLNLKSQVHKSVWSLFLLMLSVYLVAAFFGEIDFETIRALASYSSIFFSVFALYVIKKYYISDIRPYLYKANYIWLSAGFLQHIFDKDIFSFFVVVRTTEDRGVTGLAPEPGFYAIYLVFLSWIILKENNYEIRFKEKILVLMNLIFTVFIAKSSIGLLLIFTLVMTYMFIALFKSYKSTFIFFGICFASIYICNFIIEEMPDSRIASLISKIEYGPKFIIYKDASINERSKHLVYPVHGAYLDFFIPHGFNNFITTIKKLDKYYSGFFWHGEDLNVIKSGYGSVIFELGWFSLFFFYFILAALFCKNNKARGYSLAEFIGCSLLMFAAIPISFPLFSWFLALSFFNYLDVKNKPMIKNNVIASGIKAKI